MTLSRFFTATILVSSMFLTVSCKKCKVDGVDINSGAIVEGVVLYPTSGYMTSNMAGDYVIEAGDPYASRFEVSFDGGAREAVNYANYTILALPVTAKCNASFERNVTIDNAANTVTYSIKVTQCSNCKEERYTENYVMVPAFPSNYQVIRDLQIVDKE